MAANKRKSEDPLFASYRAHLPRSPLTRLVDVLPKFAWVERLACILVLLGVALLIALFLFPDVTRWVADLWEGNGSEFRGIGTALLQGYLAVASLFLGLLLFLVRPLITLRSRVIPVLVLLNSFGAWLKSSSICAAIDGPSQYCSFLAPALFPSLFVFGVIYCVRTAQYLRDPKLEPEV